MQIKGTNNKRIEVRHFTQYTHMRLHTEPRLTRAPMPFLPMVRSLVKHTCCTVKLFCSDCGVMCVWVCGM